MITRKDFVQKIFISFFTIKTKCSNHLPQERRNKNKIPFKDKKISKKEFFISTQMCTVSALEQDLMLSCKWPPLKSVTTNYVKLLFTNNKENKTKKEKI